MHRALNGGSPCASRILRFAHASLTSNLLSRQPTKQRRGDFLEHNWSVLMNGHNEFLSATSFDTEVSLLIEIFITQSSFFFFRREHQGYGDFAISNGFASIENFNIHRAIQTIISNVYYRNVDINLKLLQREGALYILYLHYIKIYIIL